MDVWSQYNVKLRKSMFGFGHFMGALNRLAEYRAANGMNKNTLYEIMVELTKIPPANQVVSVTFEYAEIFSTSGGSNGSQTFTLETVKGRSTESEISHSAMVRVDAAVCYSSDFSPISGSLEVAA